jgi:multidrug/hemolysin transport system ATP-binding protein
MKLPLFNREVQKPNINKDNILEVKDLRKTYGNLVAVNDISFSVKRKSLFAFLGLNGAGKSTTINIITSILGKDSGKVYVDGMDLDTQSDFIKNEIGIVFQNSVLDSVLSPRENLTVRAGFYGIKGEQWKARLEILTEMLGLKDFLDRPVGKLSGGQKRRVDIARAMVHNPKLLILDEPTTGLDPQTRLSVWNLVNSLRSQTGMTVFLTTHYMEEAEKATFVVIMDKGNIIATGTPTELRNKYSGDYVIIHIKNKPEIDSLLTNLKRSYSYNRDSRYYRVTVKDSTDAIDFINNNRSLMSDFEVEKGNMDDVFLNVTGVGELLEKQQNENK